MEVVEIAKQIARMRADLQPEMVQEEEWWGFRDALNFLRTSINGMVPIFVSCQHFYVYAVLIPKDRVNEDVESDVAEWNVGPSEGWGYGTMRDPHTGNEEATVFPPFDSTGSVVLNAAQPLFFLRHFDGLPGRANYVEIAQPFAHVSNIHWLADRSAYCTLDGMGDIQPVATVSCADDGILCTIERSALDFYMGLTGTVLVRLFDVTRSPSGSGFQEQRRRTVRHRDRRRGLYAKRTTTYGRNGSRQAAWLRGFQMLHSQLPAERLLARLSGAPDERQYAKFIAHDWKHGAVRNCSADPKLRGNYFEPSELPYATSPAFFRAEVLLKYKQDPEKYTVQPRLISCRGAWSLRYDINEQGQAHAFLVDLGRLPYMEQLYWKSFNVKPKGGPSRRSIESDFLGKWSSEYDPGESLLQTLDHFPIATHAGQRTQIWQPPADLHRRLHEGLARVVSESSKEWKDQVLSLAKLLVEGLDKRVLRALARSLNCDDSQLGSLKLLKRCLETRQVDAGLILDIVDPLERLWALRSSISAHEGGSLPPGDLRQHHQQLLESCDRAMRELAILVRNGHLDMQ